MNMNASPLIEQYLDAEAIKMGIYIPTTLAILDRGAKGNEVRFNGEMGSSSLLLGELLSNVFDYAIANEKGHWRVKALRCLDRLANDAEKKTLDVLFVSAFNTNELPSHLDPHNAVHGTVWEVTDYKVKPFIDTDRFDVPGHVLQRWVKAYGAMCSQALLLKAEAVLASTPNETEMLWSFKTKNFYVEFVKAPADDYLMPNAHHLNNDAVNHLAATEQLADGRMIHCHFEAWVYDISNGRDATEENLLSCVTTDVYNEEFYTTVSENPVGPFVVEPNASIRSCVLASCRRSVVKQAIRLARKSLAER